MEPSKRLTKPTPRIFTEHGSPNKHTSLVSRGVVTYLLTRQEPPGREQAHSPRPELAPFPLYCAGISLIDVYNFSQNPVMEQSPPIITNPSSLSTAAGRDTGQKLLSTSRSSLSINPGGPFERASDVTRSGYFRDDVSSLHGALGWIFPESKCGQV